MRKAQIRAVASYLPAEILSNEQLAAEYPDWPAEKILEKTGIASRRIAGAEECASDLGVFAAQKLFASGACRPDQIDYLLFCTQSPDYFLPTTACLVQDRLGLRTSCGAIDFNQGCSGFVYGLSLGKSLIESGVADRVLLVTSETYSKFINPRDRSVRTIFGDAAAATLLDTSESQQDLIGPFVFGTDGRGAENLIVRAGGMRRPLTAATAAEVEDKGGNWRSEQNLYMNGPEIFNFTLKVVPAAVNELLTRGGLKLGDVDYFIFHQANQFMLERLRAKLGIPEDKFSIEMEDCGNTVSSTIPIALERSLANGQLRSGASAMLVGFGVGYSWAAAMMRVPQAAART
jgi:3-oxoacyl-[acyl-carrier-protein] synthase III